LRIISAQFTSDGQGLVLRFPVVSNRTYTIQASDTLPATAWTRLLEVPVVTENKILSVTNAPETRFTRFLRLVTPRQP
jgi:hypothetical protein